MKFLSQSECDSFPINKNLFTEDSDFNPVHYLKNGYDLKFIYSVNLSRNINKLVPFPTEDTFYTLKYDLLEFNNATVSEQFWVFDQHKKIVPESLAEFYNVHGYEIYDAYPEDCISNNLFNSLKKKQLEKKYGKDNNFVYFAMREHLIKKHYKDIEKQFFSDKNTMHKNIPVNVFIIFNQYYANFGHYFQDMFPSLYHFWTNLSESEKENIYFPVPIHRHDTRNNPWKNYICESLQVLGIKETQLISIEHGTSYHFKKVILPQRAEMNPNIILPSFTFLKNKLIDPTLSSQYSNYKHIFIDRKANAFGKWISNKENILKVFKNYDIKSIYFEDYTLKEKFNLLANTNFIISALGGGYVNSFLTTNKIKYIVLNSRDFMHMLGYTSLISLSDTTTKINILMGPPQDKDNNLLIDTDKLDQKLNKIFH